VNILGYDPVWDHFADARFKDKHFHLTETPDSSPSGSICTPCSA